MVLTDTFQCQRTQVTRVGRDYTLLYDTMINSLHYVINTDIYYIILIILYYTII